MHMAAEHRIKKKWATKSQPRDRSLLCTYLAQIVLLIRSYCRICGLDLAQPGYRFGWLTLLSFTLSFCCWPTLIYTMISRDRIIMIRASTMLGIMGQAAIKTFIFYFNRQEVINSFYYLRSLYQRNTTSTNGNAEILLIWVKRFWLMSRLVAALVTSAIVVFVAAPIIATRTLLHERDTVLPMFYPMVDERTRSGQIVLLLFNLVYLLLGTVGILSSDLVYWNLLLHVCPMAEMWIHMLHGLDGELQRMDGDGQMDAKRRVFYELATEKSVNNLVEVQNELFGFMENLADTFEFNNLIEVATNSLSMCLVIYANYFIEWFPLYLFMIIVSLKLFVISLLGSIVEYYYDKMLSNIEQCHWYQMNVRIQRKFMLLMLRAQKPTCMIAGTKVINLDYGLSIAKSIYSMAMVLNEMETEMV